MTSSRATTPEHSALRDATTAPPELRADGIMVSFGPVRALDGVSLEVRPGEIHGLCGENGAGKSTLIRCLGGAVRPTAGTVTIGGRRLPPNVGGAEAAGVVVIHQEPLAFPDLSAEDTIFVAREPTRARGLWLDRREMRRRTIDLLASLGEHFDVRRPVGELSLAQRQMVAIARALGASSRFLVLDEPTASLSAREAATLHDLMRRLCSRGVGLLFVSHRLDEVLLLAHRVSVLRDGRLVATCAAPGLGRAELVRLMVGRDVVETAAARLDPADSESPARLDVRGLSVRGSLHEVSLAVRPGEIVGLAGLVGAGRSELARAIAGIDRSDAGTVLVAGKRVRAGSARDAIGAGVVLVPEDRHHEGLVLPLSLRANIGLSRPPGTTRFGLIARARERTLARESVDRFSIRASSIDSPGATLSGGNQQKVLLAKWLAHRPRVLILDEPTRGVDVGAKAEIHAMIRGLAAEGAAVLLISSDLPELLALSHRVLVLRAGRLVGEVSGSEANPESVLAMAVSTETDLDGEGRS